MSESIGPYCPYCDSELPINKVRYEGFSDFCPFCNKAYTVSKEMMMRPRARHSIEYEKDKEKKDTSSISYDKGSDLEKKVEKYFQHNGYQTKRNVILEGKSGGKHEIDILANKSDAVTKIKIMVECKAWDKPIEKDVVSKVNYVVQDLGLNKAIIVAFKGYRIGAEKTANELGIELWGTEELEKILGKIALAEIETKGFERTSFAFPNLMTENDAISLIENESKGFLGMGKEQFNRTILAWIPCYLFTINCSKSEGLIQKKIITKPIWNVYEALSGYLIRKFSEDPKLEEEELTGNILPPRIKDKKIVRQIVKTAEKYAEVVTSKSKTRYNKKLEELGIPTYSCSISIDNISDVYYPFFISTLSKHVKERILAVDGYYRNIDKKIGDILTTNLSYIKNSETN